MKSPWRFALLAIVLAFCPTRLCAQFSDDSHVAFIAQSSSPNLRAQGLTEAAGDILVKAARPEASLRTGTTGATATLSIFYNTNLMNAATTPSAPGASLTNSNGLLASSGIQVTFSNFRFEAGSTAFSWRAKGNVLEITITLAASSQLIFGSGGAPATIQVHGARVNPNMLGVAAVAPTHVMAAITAAPSGTLSVLGFSVFSVGQLMNGLGGSDSVSETTASSTPPSPPPPPPPPAGFAALPAIRPAATNGAMSGSALAAAADMQLAFLLSEGFVGAFTTAAQETAKSGAEVTNGTRIDIAFSNVPDGAYFLAPQVVSNVNLTLTLVEGGKILPGASPGSITRFNPSYGVCTITYEVTASNTGVGTTAAIRVPVTLAGSSPTQAGVILAGTRLSPISSVTAPSDRSPVVRFADTGFSTPINTVVLSQSDLVFTTVEKSTTPLNEGLRILSTGQGSLDWKLQTTVTGSGTWLTLNRTEGTSKLDPSTTEPVGVLVNPAGLAPGDYYGLLRASARAVNSPQLAAVHLRVLPVTSPAAPAVSQGGFIFAATEGTNPPSQSLAVSNAGGGTLPFSASVSTASGGSWLTASPATGTAPTTITLAAASASLTAGVYRGTITLSFPGGATRELAALLLVTAPGASVTALYSSREVTSVCTPVALHAVSAIVPNHFALPAHWPVPIVVRVVDNCNNPVLSASVAVSFVGLGDPLLPLRSLRDGNYSGVWTPGAAKPVKLVISAVNPPLLAASLELDGQVSAMEAGTPQISPGGVVNAASYAPRTAVAPGSIISLFGRRLLATERQASLPLSRNLGGLAVRIGDVDAPLFYAGPAQVNAQVPVELGVSSAASIIVTVDGKVSPPETLFLQQIQPGVFWYMEGSVSRGAILDQFGRPVNASNAAVPGSVIQLFATGLGPTDPPMKTGEPAPSDPPARLIGAMEATIGGVWARVEFAGLAPTFVGLYQVNLAVPLGLPSGNLPLVLSVGGVRSNEVMLPVK